MRVCVLQMFHKPKEGKTIYITLKRFIFDEQKYIYKIQVIKRDFTYPKF